MNKKEKKTHSLTDAADEDDDADGAKFIQRGHFSILTNLIKVNVLLQ